jgi:hypothetical protein
MGASFDAESPPPEGAVEISDSDEDTTETAAKAKSDGNGMWRAHMQMAGSAGGALSTAEIAQLKRKVNHTRTRKLRNYVRDVSQSSTNATLTNNGIAGPSLHLGRGGASASATLAMDDPVGLVMRDACETVPFTRSEASELFQALDTHDDGVLDFRELCEGIICMRSADGAVIPFLHRFATLVSPNISKKDVRLVRISRQEVQYMATAAIAVFLRRHAELVSRREKFIVNNRLFAEAPVPFTVDRADATIAAATASPVAEIPIDPLAIRRFLLVQFQTAHGHGRARVSARIRQSDFIFPEHEELYSRLESSKKEALLWQRCGIAVDLDEGPVAKEGSVDSDPALRAARTSQTQEAVAYQRKVAEELGRVNAIRAGMAAEAERRRVSDAAALFAACPTLAESIYELTRAHTGVEIGKDVRTSGYSAHSTSTTSRTLKAIPAYAHRCALLLTEVDRFTMLIKLLEQFVRAFEVCKCSCFT